MRAVLLDADGVLQVNPHGWDDDLRAVVPADHADAFVADLFETDHRAMTGARSFEQVVAEVTDRWGVGHRAEDVVGHWRRIEVVTDTVELAVELRAAGIGCHLATNQDELRASYMREDLGYEELLDSTFSSCDLGVTKSDPDFFTQVVTTLGLEPVQVLHVDDKQEYADAARSAGLHAVVWSVDDGPARLRQALRHHGLPV